MDFVPRKPNVDMLVDGVRVEWRTGPLNDVWGREVGR